MGKVSKEVAVEEVTKWLDYKKVSDKKRETYKENIDAIADAIVDGNLILNEDVSFTHNLLFPLNGEIPIPSLNYKPRLNAGAVQSRMQGVKPNDSDGRIHAYVSALTGQPKEVIRALDTEDLSIAQSIAIFFL